MSKFSIKKESTNHINYDGGKAFSLRPEMELVLAVLTTFLEDKYYENKDTRIKRLKLLVKKVDPIFVAKLAIFARTKFHLRRVSHLLVGELSRIHRGDSLVSTVIETIAERPDDLVEIVAYLGKPLPKQIKKGIRHALLKFNRYQLAKYRMESHKVKLVDLFNLSHPNPKFATEEQKEAWKDLIEGNLKTEETWESQLSSGKDKARVWKDLITTNKIGYMALLRNLRNILKQADQDTIAIACEQISDKNRVLKSKQFPYRFLSAYLALQKHDDEGIKFEKDIDSSDLVKALETAISYSIMNLPLLEGKTVILSDNSGSMRGDAGGLSFLSEKSERKTSDVGNLFSVLYWTKCDNTLIGLFGDKLITPPLDRKKKIFENFKILEIFAEKCGPSTETGIFTMFEKLLRENIIVNRIVIFSDTQIGKGCEWYDTSGHKKGDDFNKLVQDYRKFNPKVRIYNIDLQGYGDTVIANGAYILGGWSEKIFDFMKWIEKENDLIKFIEEVEINYKKSKDQQKK